MERTLTNLEIFNAISAIDRALQIEGSTSVFKLRAIRNLKVLKEHQDDFIETRNKILAEYAETDEAGSVARHEETMKDEDDKIIHSKGDPIFPSEEIKEEFESEVQDILNEDITVEGLKIVRFSQLGNWEVPTQLAFHAEFMFEDDLDS